MRNPWRTTAGFLVPVIGACLVVIAACTPQAGPVLKSLDYPAGIAAAVAQRDAIVFAEGDPLFDAQAGRVIEPLAGLDGCWASYVQYAEPDDVPTQFSGTLAMDVYEFYRFDLAAGTAQLQRLGDLATYGYENLVVYEGTLEILGDNRVRIVTAHMTASDSLNGPTIDYPDNFDAYLDQLAAEQGLTAEQRDELEASFEKNLTLEFLVTVEGDLATLVPTWDYLADDGTPQQGFGNPSVCRRVTCP